MNAKRLNEWHRSPYKHDLWKDFMFERKPVSFHLELWFTWIAYFMEPELEVLVEALNRTKTRDPRYADQLVQMGAWVQDTLDVCRRILVEKDRHPEHGDDFPCQCFRDRLRCREQWHEREWVGEVRMCDRTKDALVEDTIDMLGGLLVSWLSESYYVWKLYQEKRIFFPVPLSGVRIKWLPFDDIRSWEVVCGDDDKTLLSHPLLPHPSDFLEKRTITGTTYADKARFECQMPGSLEKYRVVLTRRPSVIPKLQGGFVEDTTRIFPQGTTKQAQKIAFLYTESTRGHRHGTKKKKRPLSKILKESRKKQKTQWRQRTEQEDTHFPEDTEDDNNDTTDDEDDDVWSTTDWCHYDY